MKNIKTIFLKELKRYFTEPRMLAALYLPGIIIFLVYSRALNLDSSSFGCYVTETRLAFFSLDALLPKLTRT